MTEKQFNQISFWYWMCKCYTNMTIKDRSFVFDYNWYLIMIFCPIAHHLCMALLIVICYTVKQYWSVGYVSFLTISFIQQGMAIKLTSQIFVVGIFHFCLPRFAEQKGIFRILIWTKITCFERITCQPFPFSFRLYLNSISLEWKHIKQRK